MPSVSSIMQTHIVGVSKNTKLDAAVKLMERSSVSLLPVLCDGRLIGVVTMREIEKALGSGLSDHTEVCDVMSKKVRFAEANAEIDAVARMMIKDRVARLPVVNNRRDMLCVGIVSSTEILRIRNRNE